MMRALPIEASYENRKYLLRAESGPIMLRGDADYGAKDLLTLSSIWVDCIFSHGELSVVNADPSA